MKGKEEKTKKKINNKRERGITLIALVITIIVLLILAGVSIAMLTGQNGILTQANNAKIEQSHGAVREAMSLAYNEWKIEINTGSITKLASTETVTIQGEEEKTKAPTTISFFDFLKTTKGYIDDSGKIDVEKLTGSKQALGNGETTDIYTITEQSGVYAVYYNGEEGTTSLQIWSTGDIVDWSSILEDANNNPEKYKYPGQTSEQIGIGTDGKPVNMDYWQESFKSQDNSYKTNVEDSYGYSDSGIYKCEFDEEGRIVGEIPEYIYNETSKKFLPVTDISGLFYNETDLKYAPKLPSTVTNMWNTFYGCTELTQAPEIPDGVTNMYFTFSGCTSLAQAPEIPDSVTNMSYTFSGCTSLAQVPEIPDSVTSMDSTFSGCTNLTQAPEIPNGVTDMGHIFSGCTSLTQAPEIPSSVTKIGGIFYGCTSLTQAPEIPDSVTSMDSTFEGCTSLTQAPEIPDGVTSMSSTFEGCTSLTQAPEIPDGVTNMNFTFRGCTSLTQAPEIPNSVTGLSLTFEGCVSLTGSLIINATLTAYNNSWIGCLSNAATNPGCHLILSGSCPQLQEIYNEVKDNPNITLAQ